MRRGKMIARYEFGKLSVAKSQRLSKHQGFEQAVTEPMTITEIANPHEKNNGEKPVEVIGFRLAETMMN